MIGLLLHCHCHCGGSKLQSRLAIRMLLHGWHSYHLLLQFVMWAVFHQWLCLSPSQRMLGLGRKKKSPVGFERVVKTLAKNRAPGKVR